VGVKAGKEGRKVKWMPREDNSEGRGRAGRVD